MDCKARYYAWQRSTVNVVRLRTALVSDFGTKQFWLLLFDTVCALSVPVLYGGKLYCCCCHSSAAALLQTLDRCSYHPGLWSDLWSPLQTLL
jgi:hypothetical protein